MTTKMKWKISRRLGIFLDHKPETHLPSTIASFIFLVTFPSSWYVHSGDPSGALIPSGSPPFSHKTPDLFVQAEPKSCQTPGCRPSNVCWMVSPRRMKTTNCTFKNLGGPNHRKPNLRHETQMNQRNLRFRPWEFYGWSPSVHPKGQ